MRDYPRPQEIYRHFKGNCYQIITLARNSETNEKMVVYQQLYAPYEVYVRPLEMFMSRVDTRKYPNETQKYRFERLRIREAEELSGPEPAQTSVERREAKAVSGPETVEPQEETSGLAPELMAFLDADSYERKLEILSMLHPRITDEMIDTMAVSLDTEVKEGDIEQRYNEIKNCLLTMERFECNRLR
ncbi:MAG: DUF1653 domain-containing protein [Roseburia sp.]|nr:DUF1653 domain-containing protein [Roseburia sp.]